MVTGAVGIAPEFLLAARLACLLLFILHFLGGAGERGASKEPRIAMTDTTFSLFLRSGTGLGCERRESLGMGARVFLGTETLELALESLWGTVIVGSNTARRGWGWIMDLVQTTLMKRYRNITLSQDHTPSLACEVIMEIVGRPTEVPIGW